MRTAELERRVVVKFVSPRKAEIERGINQVVVNAEGLALGRVEKDWPKRYHGFVGYHSSEPVCSWREQYYCLKKLEEAIRAKNPEPVART